MNEGKPIHLSEVTERITKGTTPTTQGDKFTSNGINYIKSECIGYDGKIDRTAFTFISEETHDKLKRSQLQVDDILFSMAGIFLGKNAIVTKDILPANTNQALAIIRLNKTKALPKYVHYYLRQPHIIDYVNNMSGQSAQPNINMEEIGSIELRLPTFPEQQSIADVLSSLDDKIDLLHQQNETLEQLAETLFRQWFIEQASGEVCQLSDIVDFHYGKSLREIERRDGQFPVVGSNGVVGFHHSYLIKAPGIVIGRKGTLGKVTYMFDNFNPIDTTYYITSKQMSNGLYYEYHLLKTVDFEKMNTDSAVPGLNRSIALSTVINKPSNEQVLSFNEICDTWFEKIRNNRTQIVRLEELRDTLLPKLMSGEVRVKH